MVGRAPCSASPTGTAGGVASLGRGRLSQQTPFWLYDGPGSLQFPVPARVIGWISRSPEGGVVTAGARLLPGQAPALELYVCDTGAGVPPELRSLIFEKYGQASNPKARRGTGLGLTFCKLAVEAHGGQIGLRDTPGGGSTFWAALPVSGTG